MKFNQSAIHSFPNMVFFRGEQTLKNSRYLYEQSSIIFGEDCLAPNLVEYEKTETPFSLDNLSLKEYLKNVEFQKNDYINFIDIRISEGPEDISIFYESPFFSDLAAESIQSALQSLGKFKVNCNKRWGGELLMKDLDHKAFRYIQIFFSRDFIQKNGFTLSPHLQSSFDARWYTDILVASFLIMTSISGSSDKGYAEDF